MLTLNLGPSGGYSGGGGDKQRESDKLDTCGPRPEGGRRKPAALRLWPRPAFCQRHLFWFLTCSFSLRKTWPSPHGPALPLRHLQPGEAS